MAPLDPRDNELLGEADEYIEALRGDLPSARDRRRLRTRLSALGIAVSGSITAAEASASAAPAVVAAAKGGATGASTLAASVNKLVALSAAQKLGVAVVIAAAAGTPLAARVVEHAIERPHVERVNVAERAQRPERTRRSTTSQARVTGATVHATSLSAVSEPAPSPGRASTTGQAAGSVPAPVPVPAPSRGRAPVPSGTRATSGAHARAPLSPSSVPTPTATHASAVAHGQSSAAPSTSNQPNASHPSGASEPPQPYAAAPVLGTAAAVATVPTTRSDSSLVREAELLERALSALSRRDLSEARRWLRVHEARFPNGRLGPERERVILRVTAAERHARAVVDTKGNSHD